MEKGAGEDSDSPGWDPGTASVTSQASSLPLQGRYGDPPTFTEEETRAQEGKTPAQGHIAN